MVRHYCSLIILKHEIFCRNYNREAPALEIGHPQLSMWKTTSDPKANMRPSENGWFRHLFSNLFARPAWPHIAVFLCYLPSIHPKGAPEKFYLQLVFFFCTTSVLFFCICLLFCGLFRHVFHVAFLPLFGPLHLCCDHEPKSICVSVRVVTDKCVAYSRYWVRVRVIWHSLNKG